MSPMRRRALRALLVLASLLVFLAPADPDAATPTWFGAPVPDVPHLDKLVHVLVFALLAYALRPAMAAHGLRGDAVTLVALAAYGALLELAQGSIPGRSASLLDGIADVAGALLGILLSRRKNAAQARRPPQLAR